MNKSNMSRLGEDKKEVSAALSVLFGGTSASLVLIALIISIIGDSHLATLTIIVAIVFILATVISGGYTLYLRHKKEKPDIPSL